MSHKRTSSLEAVIQIASISLTAMVCVVGCSTIPQTQIEVKIPADSHASKHLEDVLRIASSTAKEFGLNESESEVDGSQVCYRGFPVNDDDESIWLSVSPNEIPLLVAVTDSGSSHRSVRHKMLTNALVTKLNQAGLNASVTFQTPDPGDGVWKIFCVLGAVGGWLVWRLFPRKQVILKRSTT